MLALLAVAALGISAGAMLAEELVLVPYWRAIPPDEFLRWFAANEPLLVAFYGPLEIVAAVLTIAAAVHAAWRRAAGKGLLILAAALSVVVLLLYPLYFQDVNASFTAGTIAPDAVAAELARWSAWQWLRVTIGVAAFVSALLAVRRRDA
jgi:hypothetical protein